MPKHCPEHHWYACTECRNLHDGKCYYHTTATPIVDILTIEERVELLEQAEHKEYVPPNILSRFQQLQAQFNNLENKVNKLPIKKVGDRTPKGAVKL